MQQTNNLLFGTDLFGNPLSQAGLGKISKKFIVPPFSVLNTRDGNWKNRKQCWIRAGLSSEVGRLGIDDKLQKSSNDDYTRLISNSATGAGVKKGVSIFDPVLCEILYKWFCPPHGQIIDPFAGGSTRGIVASVGGFKYWGCDIRSEQVKANKVNGLKVVPDNLPRWVCGDSINTLQDAPDADFIFSCPPYGDLEKYSDLDDDISNMEYHAFLAAYRRIILKSLTKLKNDRFACFVVGDFRDKKGFLRNFVSDTINSFEMCKARLYNEAILITQVGSAAMRVNRQFMAGRKLCKTHQNVLVFCKGNPKKAAINCGDMLDS